ncbi:MAG: 5-methyltetrahydropteroyltriglutamate--homocysteine S-methyltransferase [Betaproteobacteria bacterium]|nr:5-methyltetrahydropteroyltriglutamate--homocysteine S-methyltransferase [Betaproteobacteria bacterium]
MAQSAQTPPFRADHVGSLLRPPELKEAREHAKRGEIDAAQLRAVEDKCIRGVAAFQESVGLQSITDGEFRRDWWHIDFLRGFDGVTTVQGATFGVHFQGADEQPPLMRVTAKIRRSKPSMLDHFKFLKSATKRAPKFCMPSPAMLHARGDREALKKTYPDPKEFWADLTRAYREEIRDLYQAGCRYLQIDDTTIAMMGDPKVQETFRKLGDDPKADTAMYADAVNAAIRDVPDDMTVCVHTCRGNFMSTWLASGSYDFVAETAFTRLDVDGFFLEYDTERGLAAVRDSGLHRRARQFGLVGGEGVDAAHVSRWRGEVGRRIRRAARARRGLRQDLRSGGGLRGIADRSRHGTGGDPALPRHRAGRPPGAAAREDSRSLNGRDEG